MAPFTHSCKYMSLHVKMRPFPALAAPGIPVARHLRRPPPATPFSPASPPSAMVPFLRLPGGVLDPDQLICDAPDLIATPEAFYQSLRALIDIEKSVVRINASHPLPNSRPDRPFPNVHPSNLYAHAAAAPSGRVFRDSDRCSRSTRSLPIHDAGTGRRAVSYFAPPGGSLRNGVVPVRIVVDALVPGHWPGRRSIVSRR